MEKLKEKWWTKKLHCSKVEDQQDGISIANIGGVFIVILVGIVLACITLIFEYWWYKYQRPSPKVIDVRECLRRDLNAVEPVEQGPSTIITHNKPNEARPRSRVNTHIQIAD